MPLCEICRKVLQDTLWGRGASGHAKRHHLSFASLLQSVDEKCFVCLRAFRTFDDHVHGWLTKVASGIANESSTMEHGLESLATDSTQQPPATRPRSDAVTTLELFLKAAIPTVNIQVFPLLLNKSLSGLREARGHAWSSETTSRIRALDAQLITYARAQNPDDHMFYLNGVIPLSMSGESTVHGLHIFQCSRDPLCPQTFSRRAP